MTTGYSTKIITEYTCGLCGYKTEELEVIEKHVEIPEITLPLGLVINRSGNIIEILTKLLRINNSNHNYEYNTFYMPQEELSKRHSQVLVGSNKSASDVKTKLKKGDIILYPEYEFKKIEPKLKEILVNTKIFDQPLIRTTPELEELIRGGGK